MENVIQLLKERGFIDQTSSEDLEKLVEKPLKVYCGFDPSADSLHLGNMVAIMGLAWFQRCGHTPVAIVGGATGMIGDPSGKSKERNLLDEATIQKNLKGIRVNLEQILAQKTPAPVVLNNYDWFKNFSFLTFLRDVGKLFRMGPMLSKDSVKSRLDSEEGMSFTEFCYQTLQGYDFLYLFENHGVTVQIGGSDQWGNIIAGTDLIRKSTGKDAFAVTFPLLTRADGQKFGKSEKGAIWLSKEKLSPYEFYQYLFRVDDRDVIRLMKMLTFMDLQEIQKIEAKMKAEGYVPNTAQKILAEEVTKLVHGEGGLNAALQATLAAKPGGEAELTLEAIEAIASELPLKEGSLSELIDQKLVDVIASLGILSSKGEVRRLIKNGGLFLNNQKVDSEDKQVDVNDLIGEKYLLIATGKKNKTLVRIKK
ncbi:MAG: tyrosine--tRNA ligase [Chlamydiia bacterium]|nr:tyrosine--tRNA ligase [Chlamydiia bacterium]